MNHIQLENAVDPHATCMSRVVPRSQHTKSVHVKHLVTISLHRRRDTLTIP